MQRSSFTTIANGGSAELASLNTIDRQQSLMFSAFGASISFTTIANGGSAEFASLNIIDRQQGLMFSALGASISFGSSDH